ncbi:unnamed protein product [Pleuronectes platessa]|nr:unnamed protein product [Pleuronectes platessa]CAB1449063.1 unnamed protein product [Pleuronectes platessa]CAB1455884.1 unnamed protein product [Pleuronectes platessa]
MDIRKLFARSRDKAARRNERATLDKEEQQSAGGGDGGVEGKGEGERDVDEHEQSCSCERTFSVLRRLHTWLRSTMGQDRLHHLAIMSVERGELSKLSQSQLIDSFAKMKQRRYRLLLKK